MYCGNKTVITPLADTFFTCCMVVYLQLALIMLGVLFNSLENSQAQHWARFLFPHTWHFQF